jgi:hypothetical protein
MPEVAITLDQNDFQRLWHTHMRWAGQGWNSEDHADRFETVDDRPIDYLWSNAYWMGDTWASVVLARGYLNALGQAHQVISDIGDDLAYAGYVLLTNYDCKSS